MNQLRTSSGAKIAPVYVVISSEMVIDAPPKDVWPHVLDYTSWQNFPIAEHLSGERGKEGEVVLLKKDEKGFSTPPYAAKTIKLEPPQRIIWKIHPAEQADGADFLGAVDFYGFVDFRLASVDGGTRFSGNNIYEYFVPYETDADLVDFHDRITAAFDAARSVTWPKLKRLAEAST